MHGTGSEEARIPVHATGGGKSGVVYLGLRFEKGEAPPAGAHPCRCSMQSMVLVGSTHCVGGR